jgi:hypothetical protein
MLLSLNSLLLPIEIYLFTITGSPVSQKWFLSFFIGFVLAGSNLLYLVLIPMEVAKKSKKHLAGTLLGVTLATSAVG